jgi:type IV secretory pathway ATPase VirB11/archaellum biosynthesis ATPase
VFSTTSWTSASLSGSSLRNVMLHRSRRHSAVIYSIHIFQNPFRIHHFKFISQAASAEPTPIKHVPPPINHVPPPSNRRQARIVKPPRGFVPSPAQKAIVEACKTHNVMVSARPGSGKTTTAEAIVQANPSTRIAVITYSKRLQLDTEKRLRRYHNADVLTFHG